ncbi:cysteine desulfurase family protein [Paenibacillus agilis]
MNEQMERIYLDHAATTPLHPDASDVMMRLAHIYGNPSSVHASGREARAIINQARDRFAAMLGCSAQELIFTSGGSESNNTAIFGAAWAAWFKAKRDGSSIMPHIITTTIEHHAVLHPIEQLERLGFSVTRVEPDHEGQISRDAVAAAIEPHTCLISVMLGNNEVGTLQPIGAIGQLARERGIVMHTDAVQALGTMELNLHELPIDFASFSAHKVNGPKGIGLLYARQGVQWEPLIHGGSQERKRRAGTENVAAIAGFVEAVQRSYSQLSDKREELIAIRDMFWEELKQYFQDRVVLNGHPTERLPHVLNVSLLDIPTETMLMNLDMAGVMAASGSACTSGSLEVSHVLQAMKLEPERMKTAVRFSFGLGNTKEQAHEAVERIKGIAERLRSRTNR